ncbi:MAG: dihydroorotate dehydrogenase electron transfer subunit, partial [Actinobacteria bacterium]|nr:dihydroorotate dehydrogenase electron transfer subunit [Actinomycetota bacterium]
DGSLGERGRVTDVLPRIIERSDSAVLYACGPMGMLQAVAKTAERYGIHSQCAVEESMACGVGVCMTCVMPVIGDDGQTRMVRSCVEGPVFRGDRVRWSEVGTVPDDTIGSIAWTQATNDSLFAASAPVAVEEDLPVDGEDAFVEASDADDEGSAS